MAGNMNDGFNGFNDDDDSLFGGGMSGGFGDDFDGGFGGGDGGFGDNFGGGDDGFGDGFGDDDLFSNTGQSNSAQGSQFSASVSNFDTQSQFQDSPEDTQAVKKQSIIFIIVGIAVLVLVIVIASFLGKKPDADEVVTNNTGVTQQNANVNVDNIMNSGNNNNQQQPQQNNQQSVITNKVDDGFTWTLITDSEEIQFNSEYSDMTFTITGIEHKARAVDTNSNLVVITTLQGSISGLSGTYEIDIPYNKGAKLVVGNSFTVHVQLGTYNGKTVVGEISY